MKKSRIISELERATGRERVKCLKAACLAASKLPQTYDSVYQRFTPSLSEDLAKNNGLPTPLMLDLQPDLKVRPPSKRRA